MSKKEEIEFKSWSISHILQVRKKEAGIPHRYVRSKKRKLEDLPDLSGQKSRSWKISEADQPHRLVRVKK